MILFLRNSKAITGTSEAGEGWKGRVNQSYANGPYLSAPYKLRGSGLSAVARCVLGSLPRATCGVLNSDLACILQAPLIMAQLSAPKAASGICGCPLKETKRPNKRPTAQHDRG